MLTRYTVSWRAWVLTGKQNVAGQLAADRRPKKGWHLWDAFVPTKMQ